MPNKIAVKAHWNPKVFWPLSLLVATGLGALAVTNVPSLGIYLFSYVMTLLYLYLLVQKGKQLVNAPPHRAISWAFMGKGLLIFFSLALVALALRERALAAIINYVAHIFILAVSLWF